MGLNMANHRLNFICVFVTIFIISEIVDASILCEETFCQNYSFDVGCVETSSTQFCNNGTQSGLWLPSPTICNCCSYCLPFYAEGQECSVGGVGDGTGVGRCGAQLTCVQEATGAYCRPMQSECLNAAMEYQERQKQGHSLLLEEAPRCDDKGLYAPAVCQETTTCRCQSEDGGELFGESVYRERSSAEDMHCGCTRMHAKIEELIGSAVSLPVEGPRCTVDGNYFSVQCDDRQCRCVDKHTGLVVGEETVNLDERPISNLTCYNAADDLFPELALQSSGPPYNFTTPCLEERKAQVLKYLEAQANGFIVDHYSSIITCLPDGTYGRVLTAQNGTKYCVDEAQQRIGDFHAHPNTSGYNDMDCSCAVQWQLMRKAGSLELPVCCSPGSFRPVQCRRGRCYCVDRGGHQTGEHVADRDVATLDCYTQNWRFC